MKNIAKAISFICISLVSFSATSSERLVKENIIGNISIKQVRVKDDKTNDGKLIIQNIIKNIVPTEDDVKNGIYVGWHPQYSSPIIEITNNNLPITPENCEDIDAKLCNEYSDDYWNGYCKTSCIAGMPELLAFDQIKKIIYFSVPTTFNGSAGQMFFVLSANLKTKKITLLTDQFNIGDSTLSPSGRYLVFSGFSEVKIYDTKTGEKTSLEHTNKSENSQNKLYLLGHVRWLGDDEFTYQEGTRHSKMQKSFDEKKEITYDIKLKKVIDSHVMPKNTYNSKPYIEPQ